MAGVGTMAWFTSGATSSNNTFVTGTLTLGGVIEGNDVHNQFATLTFENMSPGGDPTEMGTTTLKNVGSLPFYLYRITASNFVDNNLENSIDDTILDEVLMINISIGDEEVYNGRLSELVEENGGFFDPVYDVAPGETKDMVIKAYMDPNAGNTYQGLSMSADLTVHATQNDTPISGQPSSNPVFLGTTEIFNATGENYTDGNGVEWLRFTWNWDLEEWNTYTDKDELRLRFKHEVGTPDAEVYEAVMWYTNEIQLTGLTQDQVQFNTDWNTPTDQIWVKRSAFPESWETIAVEVSGGLNNGSTQLFKTIPYHQWYIQ